MTQNFPGPYEFRFFYTVGTQPGGALIHQARFSAILDIDPDPGALFTTFKCILSGGGELVASTVCDNVQDVLEDFLNSTDATIDYVELWKYIPGTFQAEYVTTYDISAAAVSVVATNPAGQTVFTMRTTNGGIFKVTLLDTVGDYATPTSYADSVQIAQDVFDYFCSPTLAPFVARDNGYPFAPLRVFPGQSEHVFKKRYGR